MAVKLRLKRMGNTHRPFYRIIAVDSRKKRDGAVIENIGTYDPVGKVEDKQVDLKKDRAAYWISVGAQASETVSGILKKQGLNPKPGTAVDAQELVSA